MKHPLLNYAIALIRFENKIELNTKIENHHILQSLCRQMNYFRLKPTESFEGKDKIKYHFTNNDCVKGLTKLPSHGIFLAPNVIAEDGSANKTWSNTNKIIDLLTKEKLTPFPALLSITAISGDYMKFSILGGVGKSTQKMAPQEAALCLITLLTNRKPCLQYRENKGQGKQPDLFNTCIIPDLPQKGMSKFIKIIDVLAHQKLPNEIYYGKVLPPSQKQKRTGYEPKRPTLFNGNFPNASRSSALSSISLLGSIGDLAKEAEYSTLARSLLEEMKEKAIYMIKYGKASSFSINNHIIDIAKNGYLRQVVDSIYHTELLKQGRRNRSGLSGKEKNESEHEYQKFDLFSARFLQLFNNPSFKDFLSFRAEYPNPIELLFNTYFNKMENIDLEIVKSARHLGKRLNLVAYLAAKAEIKEGTPNYFEKLREQKAKVLVELESAAFSAKSGDALIAQVVTRAGRLSGLDMPEEADLFMEKAMSNEITLEQAKNLLIAFSRLKNKKEAEEQPSLDEEISEIKESEIGSNANI
ncbi:type I-PGING CRISPR-associated protein Cas8c/Csp2 [Marinilabilia salmonicolor]|uniref:CRISPR-associated protein Cas8c/Csp2 n=1 Tax=Marinilabilia salmonicolor TaxID=989 RepID=A0A368UVD8_9BACT|nr:type I-PGING CRISPR-associated protein Cas8c/Csp2 [Marinilabilia salmonicolor]RCW32766.1 CRISPR-associated protein Cas8c/Csp2 [Marinilabilia salmonicolor]